MVAAVCVLAALPGPAGAAKVEVTRAQLARMDRAMRFQIAGLQYSLNPYQMRQFLALPDDGARREWIRRFWKSKDPTPTTADNEMLIEHNIRVDIARRFFGIEEWPYWDKRGEVFIRYGPPNYRGVLQGEVTAREVRPPGELWYYKRYNMVVSFEDFNLNGHYIYSINALGALQDLDPSLIEFLSYDTDVTLQHEIPEYYLDRYRAAEMDPDAAPEWTPLQEAEYGPKPSRTIRPRMNRLTERIDEIMDPDTPNMTPKNPSTQFFVTKGEKMAANFQVALEDNPTSYPFNFEKEDRFPFFFGVDQFKGGGELDRVDVNLEFPLQAPPDSVKSKTVTYEATAVYMDASYKEVGRSHREITIPVSTLREGDRFMPAQLVETLAPSYYRVAVSIHEKETGRWSAYWSTLETRRYDKNLALSDVLFASRIAPASGQSPFTRGALEVVPHPLRRYRRGAPMPIYFEVYNLGLDDKGMSSYEVEYRIVPHSPNKKGFLSRFDHSPTVSSRFESSGYRSDEPLHVTIQTQNLRPGLYDLMVRVKDVFWQSTVHREATFRIVK